VARSTGWFRPVRVTKSVSLKSRRRYPEATAVVRPLVRERRERDDGTETTATESISTDETQTTEET